MRVFFQNLRVKLATNNGEPTDPQNIGLLVPEKDHGFDFLHVQKSELPHTNWEKYGNTTYETIQITCHNHNYDIWDCFKYKKNIYIYSRKS